MKTKHPFFLEVGNWTGEGIVQFKNSSLAYPYKVVWQLKKASPTKISCTQILTLSEVGVQHEIHISFFAIDPEKSTFSVTFDNQDYGMLTGTGEWTEKTVHFTLYDTEEVKIFEATYDKKNSNTYEVQNTLLLKNKEQLIIDGLLFAPSNNSPSES